MVVGGENTGQAMRRSTRVTAEIAMGVRSLDPGFQFEEQCKTLLVNAHGCGFQCSRQLPVGIAVLFTIDGRQVTATVLNATSLGDKSGEWVIGAKLHQSGNFWGLPSPPADWTTGVTWGDASARPAAVDQYIEERATAAVQRQLEQSMAALRSEIGTLMAARETELVERVRRESSSAGGEAIGHTADQETARLREVFDTLSQQFRRDLEEHAAKQAAMIEEQLSQLQRGLAASAEDRFHIVVEEFVGKMQQDAKRLSESAIAQWQTAFEQSLQMLPGLVRENLQRERGDVHLTH